MSEFGGGYIAPLKGVNTDINLRAKRSKDVYLVNYNDNQIAISFIFVLVTSTKSTPLPHLIFL